MAAQKDPSRAIREAYFNLMNGAITYGGNPVPIFDTMSEDITDNIFVCIGNCYMDNRDNFAKFNTGVVVILQIFHRQYMGATKDVVDDIANQIRQLLITSPQGNGLVIDSPFKVLNVQAESSSFQEFNPNAERVVQRIERYRQVVEQNEF